MSGNPSHCGLNVEGEYCYQKGTNSGGDMETGRLESGEINQN